MDMNLPWPNLTETTPRKVTPSANHTDKKDHANLNSEKSVATDWKTNREGSRFSMLRRACDRGVEIIKNCVDNAIRVRHLFLSTQCLSP